MNTAAVFLLAFVASARMQTEPWCRCGAFVTYQHTELMVYEAPQIAIESCDNVGAIECKNQCAMQLNLMSDNGNLWYVTEEGITVGQYICTSLIQHWHYLLYKHKVYGYYEVCGGAWQYTGVGSQQWLCCTGGKHEHCIS